MAANGIPLHCNICPKKPNFSDVSHLLTHIASKGHLSHYYKVKVRSTHEEASRRLIDIYDRWYVEWSVEELMSDRMSQKDKRRTRARPTGTPSPPLQSHLRPLADNHSTAARPAPATRIEAPIPRHPRRAVVGNLLDPRLSEQQQAIKLEHSATPTPTPQPTGPVLRHRNTFGPRMQYWPTESRASSHSYTNADYETSSEYSDPSERRRYRYTAANSCAVEDEPIVSADPMAVSEAAKLKGVYWPGMDIFDSATPEMRRKRNQKKDSSVVEQLELNSQEVEATELIFTPQGSFKRLRRISCSESDDEDGIEIKMESPQPFRRRLALADMDANTNRRSRQTRPIAFPYSARNRYVETRGRPNYEQARSGRASKRKRGAFNVFQDDNDDEPFSQPNTLAYLTSGFSHQPLPPLPIAFGSYQPPNDPFQFENKENILSFS